MLSTFVDPLMENFVSNRFLSLMNWYFLGEKLFRAAQDIKKEKREFRFHTKSEEFFEGIERRDVVTNFEEIVMNCRLSFVRNFV